MAATAPSESRSAVRKLGIEIKEFALWWLEKKVFQFSPGGVIFGLLIALLVVPCFFYAWHTSVVTLPSLWKVGIVIMTVGVLGESLWMGAKGVYRFTWVAFAGIALCGLAVWLDGGMPQVFARDPELLKRAYGFAGAILAQHVLFALPFAWRMERD